MIEEREVAAGIAAVKRLRPYLGSLIARQIVVAVLEAAEAARAGESDGAAPRSPPGESFFGGLREPGWPRITE
jgi:hypothetical protein